MNLLDEDFYSKQLYFLGKDAQYKLSNSNILISGLGGLGVEIAKNLILTGPKSVMLHDICDTTIYDLSSQYFLKNNDIGKNRAVICRDKLSNLNKNVNICVSTNELKENLIKYYDIVILTNSSIEEQIDINNICRKYNIKFISTIT